MRRIKDGVGVCVGERGGKEVAQSGGLRARRPRKGAFGVIEVSRAPGTIIPLRERTNVPTYVRRRQDIFIGYDLIFRRSAFVERCCKSVCVRYASNSPRVGK